MKWFPWKCYHMLGKSSLFCARKRWGIVAYITSGLTHLWIHLLSHIFLSWVQAEVWDPGPVLRLLPGAGPGRPTKPWPQPFVFSCAPWPVSWASAGKHCSWALLPFALFVGCLPDTISACDVRRYDAGVIGSFLKSAIPKVIKLLGQVS